MRTSLLLKLLAEMRNNNPMLERPIEGLEIELKNWRKNNRKEYEEKMDGDLDREIVERIISFIYKYAEQEIRSTLADFEKNEHTMQFKKKSFINSYVPPLILIEKIFSFLKEKAGVDFNIDKEELQACKDFFRLKKPTQLKIWAEDAFMMTLYY